MPYLLLRNLRTHATVAFETGEIVAGRALDCGLRLEGEGSEWASGRHLRLRETGSEWTAEDLGSRNGTYLDGLRLLPDTPVQLALAQEIRFGEQGLQYRIEAFERVVDDATLIEPHPAIAAPAPVPERKPAVTTTPFLRIALRNDESGDIYRAEGRRIRIGRDAECEVQLLRQDADLVSRIHAEVWLGDDGAIRIRDADSRNGTQLNQAKVEGAVLIQQGDRLALGSTTLIVSALEATGAVQQQNRQSSPPPPPHAEAPAAAAPPPPRRSFAGKGATLFISDLFKETERTSARRVRIVVWAAVAILILAVGGIYWLSEVRVRETTERMEAQQRLAFAAQQALADSIRIASTAESERLRDEWRSAINSSAPASVIESLLVAVATAEQRTTRLEAAVTSAKAALDEQLAEAESDRNAAQRDVASLRSELSTGTNAGASGAELDRLRAMIRAAEERSATIEARVQAVRGVDLATVSQANQTAIGLVTTFLPDGVYDGSGFVITASGYMVTNRHVISRGGVRPDSVFVTMADQAIEQMAVVVAVGADAGPDLAIIRILNYKGTHVAGVDWAGQRIRQGEPAALIGFPAGLGNALDRAGRVRTSMTAGIFSKVTTDVINFDGFTIGGSSGSPIFNASGEVVAVHRAGLAEAVGMGFAVPISQLIPLLPPTLRTELGLVTP